jgi:hypothetical protein
MTPLNGLRWLKISARLALTRRSSMSRGSKTRSYGKIIAKRERIWLISTKSTDLAPKSKKECFGMAPQTPTPKRFMRL